MNWPHDGWNDFSYPSGSDRLVDAIVAWGGVEEIRERVEAHLAAGATHVCVQVLTDDPERVPEGEWADLAAVLQP